MNIKSANYLVQKYKKEKNVYRKISILEDLEKCKFESKPAKKTTIGLICICWGIEYAFLFKNFFLKHLNQNVKNKEKMTIIVGTDLETYKILKKYTEDEEFEWNIEFRNFSSVILDQGLNQFEKLGIVFQKIFNEELQNDFREKIVLCNPDQIFTKEMFDYLLSQKFKKICAITAPIRSSYEDLLRHERNNTQSTLLERAIKAMHPMQTDLCAFSYKKGFKAIHREINAEPWGFGAWISEKKYIFKAIVYVLCSLNLELVRKKINKIEITKVAPDIGFLEKMNLIDDDIDWITNCEKMASIDVSLKSRKNKCWVGAGILIKLLAKRFAFLNVGAVNRLCLDKVFKFGGSLNLNEQKLEEKVLKLFYKELFLKKACVYAKSVFSRKARNLISEHKKYNEYLLELI
jgi:hypothetical protein